MNSEKKPLQKQPMPTPASKGIRLKPSVTDYATFAAATDEALGLIVKYKQPMKPNKRMLWLANSKYSGNLNRLSMSSE